MIAPKVATEIDQTLNPVTPVPPRSCTTNPPMRAPIIPITIVRRKPPGWVPSRYDQLAQDPSDEPNHDPGYDPYLHLLTRFLSRTSAYTTRILSIENTQKLLSVIEL